MFCNRDLLIYPDLLIGLNLDVHKIVISNPAMCRVFLIYLANTPLPVTCLVKLDLIISDLVLFPGNYFWILPFLKVGQFYPVRKQVENRLKSLEMYNNIKNTFLRYCLQEVSSFSI